MYVGGAVFQYFNTSHLLCDFPSHCSQSKVFNWMVHTQPLGATQLSAHTHIYVHMHTISGDTGQSVSMTHHMFAGKQEDLSVYLSTS